MALDPYKVGRYLLAWIDSTANLGHVTPRGTSVYMHPQDEEGKFVRAMMKGDRTEEILERWPFLSGARIYPQGHVFEEREPYKLRAVNGGVRRKRDPGFGRLSGKDGS